MQKLIRTVFILPETGRWTLIHAGWRRSRFIYLGNWGSWLAVCDRERRERMITLKSKLSNKPNLLFPLSPHIALLISASHGYWRRKRKIARQPFCCEVYRTDFFFSLSLSSPLSLFFIIDYSIILQGYSSKRSLQLPIVTSAILISPKSESLRQEKDRHRNNNSCLACNNNNSRISRHLYWMLTSSIWIKVGYETKRLKKYEAVQLFSLIPS